MTPAKKKAILATVPTSWLDPLLTGPDRVIPSDCNCCAGIEALLRGIKARIAAELSRKK